MEPIAIIPANPSEPNPADKSKSNKSKKSKPKKSGGNPVAAKTLTEKEVQTKLRSATTKTSQRLKAEHEKEIARIKGRGNNPVSSNPSDKRVLEMGLGAVATIILIDELSELELPWIGKFLQDWAFVPVLVGGLIAMKMTSGRGRYVSTGVVLVAAAAGALKLWDYVTKWVRENVAAVEVGTGAADIAEMAVGPIEDLAEDLAAAVGGEAGGLEFGGRVPVQENRQVRQAVKPRYGGRGRARGPVPGQFGYLEVGNALLS